MNALDKRFLSIASASRWQQQKIAHDGESTVDRKLARLCLILDWPGQPKEANGQFGKGKMPGGGSTTPNEKEGSQSGEKRGTMYVEQIIREYNANPRALGKTTPKQKYDDLIAHGVDVKSLGRGAHKGRSFEDGGGFRASIGKDGMSFQYHPEKGSHHGGAYYKVSFGKNGIRRFDMRGNEKPEKKGGK